MRRGSIDIWVIVIIVILAYDSLRSGGFSDPITWLSEKLIILHTKKARFRFDYPVAWTRDGEAGGEYRDIMIRNIPCPVKLIF